MSSIEIRDNVPPPEKSDVPEIPFDDMEVNQSCVVEIQTANDKATIRQRITRFQQKNTPKRFSMNKVAAFLSSGYPDPDYELGVEKVRIHRIKDAQ